MDVVTGKEGIPVNPVLYHWEDPKINFLFSKSQARI